MNKDTKSRYWDVLWQSIETIGIYPQGGKEPEERDAYEMGWNDCLGTIMNSCIMIDDFIKEQDKDISKKLIKLLDGEIVFFSISKKEAIFGKNITMSVGCNDIFWWACADAEEIKADEISELYNYVYDEKGKKRKQWGSVEWACKKRGIRPQHSVEDDMKKAGAWTDELESLPVRGDTG